MKIDFRLVVATNRNLKAMVEEGKCREDLYYRLNVIELHIPPLRERPEDIPLLISHFTRIYSQKNNRPISNLTEEALDVLRLYRWPGNVRELENVIERAVVLARSDKLGLEDIPDAVCRAVGDVPTAIRRDGTNVVIPVGTKLADVERAMIKETLNETAGDKSLAAQILGIAARTIYRKLEAERSETSSGPPNQSSEEIGS